MNYDILHLAITFAAVVFAALGISSSMHWKDRFNKSNDYARNLIDDHARDSNNLKSTIKDLKERNEKLYDKNDAAAKDNRELVKMSQDALTELKSRYDEKIKGIESTHKEAIETLMAGHETYIKEVEELHYNAMQENDAAHVSEIKRLEKEHYEAMDRNNEAFISISEQYIAATEAHQALADRVKNVLESVEDFVEGLRKGNEYFDGANDDIQIDNIEPLKDPEQRVEDVVPTAVVPRKTHNTPDISVALHEDNFEDVVGKLPSIDDDDEESPNPFFKGHDDTPPDSLELIPKEEMLKRLED